MRTSTVLSPQSKKWSPTIAGSFDALPTRGPEPASVREVWLGERAGVRARGAMALVLLGALAAALRFYRLGTENFWIDEVSTLQVASQRLADIVTNYRLSADLAFRDQAPLSFLVAHFFVSPHHAEWMFRMPSA